MEENTQEQFLLFAKEGNFPLIQKLLHSRRDKTNSLDINCRCKWGEGVGKFNSGYNITSGVPWKVLDFLISITAESKSTLRWTALHLACNSGHRDVVEELLKAGVDVNVQDDIGDTPLHKAAYTGRKEIVLLLLRYNACANIINGTARIPKDVTDDDEIITMLEAAERREMRRQEERLLEAAREGDLSTLSKLLSAKEAPDIHCRDSVGNTPLHCAAYRGQKHCIIKLLKSGASSNIKNNQTALDLVQTEELKQMIAAYQKKDVTSEVQKVEGPLWKVHRCQKPMHRLELENRDVKPWDHCFFMLRCIDDTVHNFKVPSKMDSIATRKAR
ncbi:hypothetical protein CCH79_00005333 [Gambusia affinis]|uniref:Uncharacterized protein n=1 Tax=Gambusia affinis TaxID=33528 RepID=A0A315VPV7_GAMAF|nr:hypothetical protein CCH79_00005333 [Gambusia affinis]